MDADGIGVASQYSRLHVYALLPLQPSVLAERGSALLRTRRSDAERLEASDDSRARVLDIPASTPMPAGISGSARYLVRYWLFYAFEAWRSRGDRLWQAHEGDWENVSLP